MTVLVLKEEKSCHSNIDLVAEEPLSIYVDNNLFSVIMRTPGEETAHAIGFCLAQGVINSLNDIDSISFKSSNIDIHSNSIYIILKNSCKDRFNKLIKKHNTINSVKIGVWDEQNTDNNLLELNNIEKKGCFSVLDAKRCLNMLPKVQSLRDKTRATHGAAIFDIDFKLLSFAEDVGRHNALDKAVGKLLMNRELNKAFILVLSSRISDELVRKAIRARIPVIIAVSRPTAKAVELGRLFNITLATFIKEELLLFSGQERIQTIT